MWPCTKISRFIGDYLFRLFKVSINYMQLTPPNNTKILASMPPPPKFDIGKDLFPLQNSCTTQRKFLMSIKEF